MTFPPAAFCSDAELGYLRSRTRFDSGRGLSLDEQYRLAHLPLVAPHHPRVIRQREGANYFMGRHAPVFSLGLPVDGDALFASDAYRELEKDIRDLPFRRKIAWEMIEPRRSKLHATLCNGLAVGDSPPTIDARTRRELGRLGPLRVELRGLFSGNVNVGRLYLRTYPERRDGRNVFRDIQRLLGRPETDLYVVGLYNLNDDLDPGEAAALGQLIERWWDRPILQYEVGRLWLLQASDDLVLDGGIVEAISL